MQIYKIPELPWKRDSDISKIDCNYYLILVDPFSDYSEIDKLSYMTSNIAINRCK